MEDFDRPLNDRGKRDVPKMASRLGERDIHPQQMITSPATRGYATCLGFAEVLGFPADQIVQDKRIYHASVHTLIAVIQQIPELDTPHPVLLVGHNPGLTELVNDLLDENIDNIPTTGIASCRLMINRWQEAHPGCGELEFFDFPKRTT